MCARKKFDMERADAYRSLGFQLSPPFVDYAPIPVDPDHSLKTPDITVGQPGAKYLSASVEIAGFH